MGATLWHSAWHRGLDRWPWSSTAAGRLPNTFRLTVTRGGREVEGEGERVKKIGSVREKGHEREGGGREILVTLTLSETAYSA